MESLVNISICFGVILGWLTLCRSFDGAPDGLKIGNGCIVFAMIFALVAKICFPIHLDSTAQKIAVIYFFAIFFGIVIAGLIIISNKDLRHR